MLSLQLQNFTDVRHILKNRLIDAPIVRTERWQGMDVSKNPAAATREILNACFEVPLYGIMDPKHWAVDCAANLPWADDHFLERVGGEPLNPGKEWANWPWAGSAAKHKTDRFNHSYMERLWPKFARRTEDGTLPTPSYQGTRKAVRKYPTGDLRPRWGIAHHYGDLEDIVELLAKEPFTRQAWIPLFFPEDTGEGDGGRKPCTLGYQIIVRTDPTDGIPKGHLYYPLRSCDFVHHFPDDCYLAVRLLIWVIEECRKRSADFWHSVVPGSLAMHMTSLHLFENDRNQMLAGNRGT